jgi:iron complex outermembrane receptor protein
MLDLPAGRLGDALVALGRQAGVSIGVSDPALAGQRVPAVRGRMAVEVALARMLRETDAQPVALDARSFRIVRRPPPRPASAARPSPPAPVTGPPPTPIEVDQMVVTGSRRHVFLSAYAGGVQIVDGSDPALATGLPGSEALASRLVGLSSTHLGSGRDKLFIRGIADSSFSGPTQATAGQYLGETRLNYNAPDPNLRLYDIDRIEVLEGPQGTLYGAGSLGGVIRMIPNRPDTQRGEGSAAIGASATEHGDPGADFAAMLNFPIVPDQLALRLVAYGATEGGYIDDSGRGLADVNRVRTIGGRAALRLETPAGWTANLGATVQRIRGEDAQYADRDAPPLTRDSGVAQPFGSDYLLADLVVGRDWGTTRLTSAFGFVRHRLDEIFDATIGNLPPRLFAQETNVTLLSAETRLSGETGRFSWVVGTSLISNRSEQRRLFGPATDPVPLLAPANAFTSVTPYAGRVIELMPAGAQPSLTAFALPGVGVRNAIEEGALFGEASFHLAPDLILTGGARISHSRLSGAALDAFALVLQPRFGAHANRGETAFLPSIALSWTVRPRLLLYARYQEGFRPGGLAVSDLFIRRFRNDDLATAEAGLRYGRPGAGPWDLSVSGAYTRWTDIQADAISMAGFPTTANIGDGRIFTLEARLGWRPLPGLGLEAAAIANDSRVVNPFPGIDIVSGFPLPNVADFSARFGADYLAWVAPGYALRLSGTVRYVGNSVLGVGPILGKEQGQLLDVGVGARIEHGPHAVSLTVSNLFDEAGNRFAMGSPFTLIENPQVTPLRPRSVRLGWQVAF